MTKAQVQHVLTLLPEDFALEDLFEHLVVVQKVNDAQRSIDENGGVPHEEVVKHMQDYMKKRRDEQQHRMVA